MPIENFQDEFKVDPEKLLAEQFDGYLGAMERFYNQYVIIPAGSYTLGSHRGGKNLMPITQEQMQAFYFGKFPITNALFEVFVERTGYITTAEKKGFGFVYSGRFLQKTDKRTGRKISVWQASMNRQKTEGAFWYQPFGPASNLHGKRNHPVVQVSLDDARAFAAWTGKAIPTEYEWEAAARTLDYMLYPWGNEWISGRCNVESSAVSDTTPVDAFPLSVNSFEIEDLAGNVYEWTETLADSISSPDTGRVFYIAKGGSWISPDGFDMSQRNIFPADFSSNIVGFRCVAR
jgi:formylglycine-generating enzyme required for sulfatase activity